MAHAHELHSGHRRTLQSVFIEKEKTYYPLDTQCVVVCDGERLRRG